MKKHIITISGNIASGKSEVAKSLAEKLSYEVYKASEEFRCKAREYNMTLVEFNEYLVANSEIDKYVDTCTQEYVKQKDNLIVDARLGFYISQDSFKVYLKANLEEAAKRLYVVAKERGREENYASVDEARAAIKEREKAERDRYISRYGVDILDLANYDLVVDTTRVSSEEVVNIVLKQYNEWLQKKD